MSSRIKYPLVFIHGMFGWGADEGIDSKIPYWGATTCNLMDYLAEQGYEVYSTSSGPISSAWDRACEIYARLTGTRVDYGKVHSERARHRRYGRTYTEPLIKGWSEEKKIHLIGHSHGGTAARVLAYFLTFGSEEERNGTPENELSELFKGGHENLIQSLTAICTPHNGTSAYPVAKKFKILQPLKFVAFNYIGIVGRTRAQGGIFDFHLEQYGLSNTPGLKDAFPFGHAKKMLASNYDNVEYDLDPLGARLTNSYLEISPNIYYYSYAFTNVVNMKNWPAHHRAKLCDFPFLTATSDLILIYNRFFAGGTGDFLDYANDGLVNLRSAMCPDDEPNKEFDSSDIRPGIWNVMPFRSGDHGSPIGLFADKNELFGFYSELLENIRKAESN